ncbi:UNVERIFIED_CONTAM: hypothetical protein NY603_36825, partial [Bacteroidetes bacterium 56_B9]
ALIAAAAPQRASTISTPFGAVAAGHVPFSATGAVDPALALQATRGEADLAAAASMYENMKESLQLSEEEQGMIEEDEEADE